MAAVDEDQATLSKDQERAITELFGEKFLQLSKNEQESLSKVLFPDTHTETVEVLGVKRTLRPLTLKFSKRIFEALKDISGQIQANVSTLKGVDMTDEVIQALSLAAVILCEFYQWTDVKDAIATDDISLAELQSIVVVQQKINGANDFLLGPLRVIVRILQINEVAQLKFNSMFSSRVSPESGIAL